MINSLGDVASVVISIPVMMVTRYLIPWLIKKSANESLQNAKVLVDIAVNAAEQKAIAGIIDKVAKKDNVLEFIEKQNIKVDSDIIDEMIESAVLKLPLIKK